MGLHGRAHSTWGASSDDVTGLKGEGRTQELDDVITVEDQIVGICFLTHLAIDESAEHQVVRVNFVRGHDGRAKRVVGVPRFAHGELRRGSQKLPLANAHIIQHAEASDYFVGIGFAHAAARFADDYTQFPFVIEHIGFAWRVNWRVRAIRSGSLFCENHRVFGDFHIALFRMSSVV